VEFVGKFLEQEVKELPLELGIILLEQAGVCKRERTERVGGVSQAIRFHPLLCQRVPHDVLESSDVGRNTSVVFRSELEPYGQLATDNLNRHMRTS
jgi:hypothetical protein